MTLDLLRKIGLDEGEERVYSYLLDHGPSTAGAVIAGVGLKRGNVYNILKRLAGKELAEQYEKDDVSHFRLNHPRAIEALLLRQTTAVEETKRLLSEELSKLINRFKHANHKPNVRYFEGSEAVREIYDDILEQGKPLLLMRSPEEEKTHPQEIRQFIRERIKCGITVDSITPKHPKANKDPERDKAMLFHRTWVSPEQYSEPIEVDIYSDRIAFIDFGNETRSVIIENGRIAEAMKKIFALAKIGAEATTKPLNRE